MSRRVRSYERQRCRGDNHKPHCKHLNPPDVGRPNLNKRALAQAARRAREREISPSLSPVEQVSTPPGFGGINVQETTPLISHRQPHAGLNWTQVSCTCSCHFYSRRRVGDRIITNCDDRTCPETWLVAA